MNHVLMDGSSVPLPVPVVRAAVHGSGDGGSFDPPDLCVRVLPLGQDGRLLPHPGDAGVPSGPQPLRGLPPRRHGDGVMAAVEVHFGHLAPGVRRGVLLLSAADERTPLSAAGALQLTLWDTGGEGALAVLPLRLTSPSDTTLVCGEFRGEPQGWEFAVTLGGFPNEAAAVAGYRRPSLPPAPAAGGPAEFAAQTPPKPAYLPVYGYPQPDPDFALPPQGPQFLATRRED